MNIWSNFPRAICLPDNCGCELVDLNALIAQPSAFWSSAFHLIFPLILYLGITERSQKLKLWIFSLVILGLSSHFAHGSFLEFGMAMDFAGIVLIMSFFPLYKWLVKWVSSTPMLVVLLLGYQGGLWMTFYSLDKWFKVGVVVVIFLISMVELMHTEGKAFWKARDLHLALVALVVSFAFFMMDELRIICDPRGWITGHSIWHFGTGLCIYFYGKWRFRVT